MPTFRYNPGPDEPEVVRTQGRTFQAGESFELGDKDPLLNKFRGHPQFEEQGAKETDNPNEQQAQQNAKAMDKIQGDRKQIGEARQKAQEALAKAEADERRVSLSERALGTMSPAEQRAMDQIRGRRGEDGPPVPGEPGYRGAQAGEVRDDVSGGGVTGTPGVGGPNQQAKAENRPQ